jgi:hypothetical protein
VKEIVLIRVYFLKMCASIFFTIFVVQPLNSDGGSLSADRNADPRNSWCRCGRVRNGMLQHPRPCTIPCLKTNQKLIWLSWISVSPDSSQTHVPRLTSGSQFLKVIALGRIESCWQTGCCERLNGKRQSAIYKWNTINFKLTSNGIE